MLLVFVGVVLLVLALEHFNAPVPGGHVQPATLGPSAASSTPRVLPSRRRAEFLMVVAGLGLGSWLAVFLALWSFPSYVGAGTHFAPENARFERHLHATYAYGLMVLLPALILLLVANWRWRRAGHPQGRRPWLRRGWANPILGASYRALGRATTVKMVASGATCAWLAWALAHYRFGA